MSEDSDGVLSENFRKEAEGFHLSKLPGTILTRAFNNSYNITYGFVSTNVGKEEWKRLFAAVHEAETPGALLEFAELNNDRAKFELASKVFELEGYYEDSLLLYGQR